jgi:hypothetical protein
VRKSASNECIAECRSAVVTHRQIVKCVTSCRHHKKMPPENTCRFAGVGLRPEPPLGVSVWWGDYALALPTRAGDPLVIWRHVCPFWLGREVRQGAEGDWRPRADGQRFEPCFCVPPSREPSRRQWQTAGEADLLTWANSKLRQIGRTPQSIYADRDTLAQIGLGREVQSRRGLKRLDTDDEHAQQMRKLRDKRRELPTPSSRDYAHRLMFEQALEAQFAEWSRSMTGKRRPSLHDDAQVAAVYVEECERGKGARARTADALQLSLSALDATLLRCRRRKLLSPTSPGRAGGNLTDFARTTLGR